jgi:hypothetical protein
MADHSDHEYVGMNGDVLPAASVGASSQEAGTAAAAAVQQPDESAPVAVEHGDNVPVEAGAQEGGEHRNGAVEIPGDGANRHVEAGRKGARRVHELIRQGKLYEQEHGLKRGRQRLRQLIEEGKLYEQEHGLRVTKIRARRVRLSGEQALLNFFQALLRLTRPAFRARLLRMIQTLDAGKNEAEALHH